MLIARRLLLTGLCFMCFAPMAHADLHIDRYMTMGVWADTVQGGSIRIGGAFGKYWSGESQIVAGAEFGLLANKQFVGVRSSSLHAWGGIDLAHWKTRAHTFAARANTHYVGAELQLLIVRAGVMVPVTGKTQPYLTCGLGLSY
ncbi:MAG: hypothetical protein QM776_02555 [Rhodocyclaceae bacterium]